MVRSSSRFSFSSSSCAALRRIVVDQLHAAIPKYFESDDDRIKYKFACFSKGIADFLPAPIYTCSVVGCHHEFERKPKDAATAICGGCRTKRYLDNLKHRDTDAAKAV